MFFPVTYFTTHTTSTVTVTIDGKTDQIQKDKITKGIITGSKKDIIEDDFLNLNEQKINILENDENQDQKQNVDDMNSDDLEKEIEKLNLLQEDNDNNLEPSLI